MSRLFLQETAKYKDLVDLTLCCMLFKVCNCRQFEQMKGTEFADFMNLKQSTTKITVRSRENNRVCYLLYIVSKEFCNPDVGMEWVMKMLDCCNISLEYYKSHYKDAESIGTSKANKIFVEDVRKAFKIAKEYM